MPDRVLIQAHVHLTCTDMDLCHTPKMGWGIKQEMYEVPRNEAMVRQICDCTSEWWERHIVESREPEGTPRLETVKRRIREAQKSVEVPVELIQEWRRAVKLCTCVEKLKEQALANVLTALTNAEIGTCSLGTVTCFAQQRNGYVVQPKASRTARWKEDKTAA